MSDPVTNMNVEDVLSSIRRLVSEDPGARKILRSEPQSDRRAPPSGKLVLTAAQRVEDTAAAAPEAPELPLEPAAETPAEQPVAEVETVAAMIEAARNEAAEAVPEAEAAPEPEAATAPEAKPEPPVLVARPEHRDEKLVRIEALARKLLLPANADAKESILSEIRSLMAAQPEMATGPVAQLVLSSADEWDDAPAAEVELDGEMPEMAVTPDEGDAPDLRDTAAAEPVEEEPEYLSSDMQDPYFADTGDNDEPLRLVRADTVAPAGGQPDVPEDLPRAVQTPAQAAKTLEQKISELERLVGRSGVEFEPETADFGDNAAAPAPEAEMPWDFTPDTAEEAEAQAEAEAEQALDGAALPEDYLPEDDNAEAALPEDVLPEDDSAEAALPEDTLPEDLPAEAEEAEAEDDLTEAGADMTLEETMARVADAVAMEEPEADEAEEDAVEDDPRAIAFAHRDLGARKPPVPETEDDETTFDDVEPAVDAKPEPAATRVTATPARPSGKPELHVIHSNDDLDLPTLDEDELHELVARVIRKELQGVLGERITRNVRKLVRREIQRALMHRDLD
ncbi:MAG: hypothetical protein KDK26_11385 [Roseivivax sp.]|nr:hypothetical protein [Roseivivax sp.]